MYKIFFTFLFFCILPFTITFADDVGIDLPPAVYAAQEAKASAHNYGRTLCNDPRYFCKKVGSNDTWFSLFPNFQQREEVMRLNRTNVALAYRSWIVIPKSFKKTTYMDMSPLPKHMYTNHQKLVVLNLRLFAFGAYNKNGNLLYWGPLSSGQKICPGGSGICSTPTGNFKVFHMEGKNCVSNEYPLETHGGAPMPYCMFFHNGTAFHESTLSGFINRSAGCVRMFNADAKWLNKKFVTIGTRVLVTNG